MTPTGAEQTELSDSAPTLSYRAAVTAALADALAADDRCIVMGEDVAASGGVFKTTVGLVERFGPARVFNTPICENGFLGVALGMAITGLRPIVEIMFSDFLAMGADALVNEIAKFRFLSGSQYSVPLTVRAIGGGSGRFGAQHSATGESWFMQQPGLKIATLSSPDAAYAVLRAAIEDENPTLVIEHKSLYERSGPVDRSAARPIGRAETVRRGADATVVSTLMMLDRSRTAATRLAEEGLDVEIIDLTWLRPLDLGTVEASVRRTGRLLVVEEQVHAGGWGATVISELAMRGVAMTVAPRALSIADDVLLPYSPSLEDAILPSVDAIAEALRALVRR
jgi:pyruvate dehydrogenase E1 component beta subunit